MKVIKSLLVVLGFGLLSAIAHAQNPETGALMTDPNIGCAYGYDQYGYMNCGGSSGSSGSARPQPPKVVNRYGAVAYDPVTGTVATSKLQDSLLTAKQNALSQCGKKSCMIAASYSNQCVGVAWGSAKRGSQVIAEAGTSIQVAQNNALKKCSRLAKNCQIYLSECSKYN